MKRQIMVLCLALAGWSGAGLVPHPALAASLCVGSGSGCYSTIQAGLNAAHDGDVIHVDPGTFAGGITVNVSVQLIGAGAASTIIKGGGPVVTIGQDGAATEPTVSITGVTITGGLNTSNPLPYFARGGGIAVPAAANGAIGATVTITDSVITGNAAIPSASIPVSFICPTCQFAGGIGGGISNLGTMALTNTTVSNNQSGDRPGLPAFASDAEGAGILDGFGAILTLKNSVVTGNHAVATAPNGRFADSGGIMARPGASLTIDGSTVSDNAADLSTAINTAGPTGTGIGANSGGLHVQQDFSSGVMATATIRDSTITGNEVSATNQSGDAVAFSGGIDDDGSLTLRDSTVSNNQVTGTSTFTGSPAGSAFTDSGGIEIEGPATISNTKFTGNSVSAMSIAGQAVAGGGAISPGSPTPGVMTTVSNSLFSGNAVSATSTTGSVSAGGGGLSNVGALLVRDTTVSYNSVTATGPSGYAQGGGIANVNIGFGSPQLTLQDGAITHNTLTASPGMSLQGGGIYNGSGGAVRVANTAIAKNTPDNCYPPNTIAGCSG